MPQASSETTTGMGMTSGRDRTSPEPPRTGEGRTPDRDMLSEMRGILLPRWRAIHEADVTWRRSKAVPETTSQAMCRHSVAFMTRLMNEADRLNDVEPRSKDSLSSSWKVARGFVDAARLPAVPGYVSRDPTHYVMVGRAGMIIDLTADQFGLDPLEVHQPSAFFADPPIAADPGLTATTKAWAATAEGARAVGRLAAI